MLDKTASAVLEPPAESQPTGAIPAPTPPAKTFIETQFPVSLLSKECYKERKAGAGQTLTALGSYWKGRKPLILVRACILGCLLPASADPELDRQVFLKLMLMDEEGLRKRWKKSIPASEVEERLGRAACSDAIESGKWRRGIALAAREDLQRRAFVKMGYDDKLEYCLRPEEMPTEAWDDVWPFVNRHLGTKASSMSGLVEELGVRKFGHRPRVADTFCGGGSIPFEAARLGCDVHASDLNPVAAMLTWGALNVIGSSTDLTTRLAKLQHEIAAKVRRTIDDLGVETGTNGWRGKVYLYCLEVKCPQTGWLIPLAPSWVISETHRVIAELVPDKRLKRFDIQIVKDASDEQLEKARKGTIRDGFVHHPSDARVQIKIRTIRGDDQPGAGEFGNCLRQWTKQDFQPRPDDIYQERLYCIQWTRTRFDRDKKREITETEFRAVGKSDLDREQLVCENVARHLAGWQRDGLVPESMIESGEKTDEPIRTRGWTHWHHLFHPRQLLTLAMYKREIDAVEAPVLQGAMAVVFCKVLDWNNRLCHWNGTRSEPEDLFYNQAFNTFYNYPVRGAVYVENHSRKAILAQPLSQSVHQVHVLPAADYQDVNDLCITDPPYGDAVNYHEITEFFIAWMRKRAPRVFRDWTWDSRRALAVKGNDIGFRRSMVEAYQRLTESMSPDGVQIVMFTHSDVSIWAGIALILWASGLKVTAAWSIATETEGNFKQGNFVKGTVLLVLRKRISHENAWSGRLGGKIRAAVEMHIERLTRLDDKEQPNFTDADYQRVGYAAALEVLTQYKTLDGQDVMAEVLRDSKPGEPSKVEQLLKEARRAASEFRIPKKLGWTEGPAVPGRLSGREIWSDCTPEERFFLSGVQLENAGESQVGAYQQTAQVFGIQDYRAHMGEAKANKARLKTAAEWKGTQLTYRGDTAKEDAFASSVVRHALYGIHLAIKDKDLRAALNWFDNSMPDYWDRRKRLIGILEYLATATTPERAEEAVVARDLAGAVLNHGS